MAQPTRAEVAALVRRAQMQLRRAQELHADLKTLMAQVDRLARLGVINRRKLPRTSGR